MVNVNVTGGEMSQAEINSYIDRAQKLYPEKTIEAIDLKIDGDFVDVDYHFADVPFQRIRRITGYLVGTLDRFNDAKRAEVRDRVKHGLTSQSTAN
ncbi:anaerobic ribonucleoside-triphosphate reductase [uncultured Ruminococcus sp.]|uniref:anaerobic ribonucleoside-triphosphate reductase n=1 Tax=uncultured Ruminococcus sp. TaxID=165186 RepID=UPI0015B66304|nr:anaerobic ribonucleoside-triphosphate reductase [uncultured Ruminococcus sp.]